ncbi:hypothetical protein OIU78_001744 [Salix suchowensis]|nr:hypothetical protein OIU78_001744 [Salix suchowensis]
MGRKPRCSEDGLNKGAWTPLENEMLADYVKIHGEGKWSNIVKETETSSNFKNHQTIESQCCTPGVAAPTTALQENNMAQDLAGTLAMAPSNTHKENGSSRKGLASGDDDNLSNILTDFHYMEDFYKILDSDYPKLNDINDITGTASHHSNNTIQVDDEDCYSMSINGCNPREIAEFSEKLMEADWTSDNCVQPDQGFDFMSLLSFLDSADQ